LKFACVALVSTMADGRTASRAGMFAFAELVRIHGEIA
jgi:hypothetical protein